MTAIARNTLALAALSAASCRPTGEISLNNDLRTIDEIIAWIKPDAIVSAGWTWRDAIAESLEAGSAVDFDTIPASAFYDELPDSDLDQDLPRGWTAQAMFEAASCASLEHRTGIDRW